MICIKTDLMKLPQRCDECDWWQTDPHPRKGWVDWCGLCKEVTDDDASDGWLYDGEKRPNNCPLVDVKVVEDAN